MLEGATIHVHDLLVELDTEFPESRAHQQISGSRTMLVTPLLREGVSIGSIMIRRTEVRPFTDKQIKLLETFASQAVIAIENVRLFQELQVRNRDLTEALEQQTATSEVLRVIASSPTELQPVLDTLIANAVRLSGATKGHVRQFDGEFHRVVAHYGETAEMIAILRANPLPASPEIPAARAHVGGKTIHILDVQAESGVHLGLARQMGTRTMLAVPLLREETNIGSLTIWRDIVEPFSERQMEVVKTFADQAVIAIENVRLFNELKESLEQQTATSEILGVIASSPTDIQPVLDVVAENAARLCEASDALIYRQAEGRVHLAAQFGDIPVGPDPMPITRGFVGGRAIIDRKTIHVHDVSVENETDYPEAKHLQRIAGARTVLGTPLLRQGEPIGSIVIRRQEVRPFTEKHIKLLETFADQAVIAIENVRLFNELDARNRQLTEALEQQTATSEILRVISSSPTDLQPVMDTIAESAARLCDSGDAQIYRVETAFMRKVASYGTIPAASAVGDTRSIVRGSVTGRAIIDRQIIHIQDMMAQGEEDYPEGRRIDERMGIRTSLAVPLLRESVAVGAILIRRKEVRPFTDKQIALLKTFADQAVIAIENVRLFRELEDRNRQITEALEQQTATSEILGVIASSPTDIQPVLDVVAGT